MSLTRDVLRIDPDIVRGEITAAIRHYVLKTLRRRGAVIGVSGGIDSSVCAVLCAESLGNQNTLVLLMPEHDSSPDSLRLGKQLAEKFSIPYMVENIEGILEGTACYEHQLEAIRQVFPDYGPGWKHKLSIPSILDGDRLNVSRLTVQNPIGETMTARLPVGAYLQLVAATNFKQRTRTMLEYYHADRLHYAVCGTPNRLEYDQGFFVKGGDGLADFKPIAHLYKTQVYLLGRALGIPEEICDRTPTTDTFSLSQTQQEFYFSLPYEQMDLCLYGHNHNIPPGDVASAVGLTPDQVSHVYKDIESKRRTTLPLHLTSLLISPVDEIRHGVESVLGAKDRQP